MSSNFTIKRICQHCNREFDARTLVTKYCSHKCNQRAYKARKRDERIAQSNDSTAKAFSRPIEELRAKEYLTVNEVCKLVGLSRRTVYRLFEQGQLERIKVGSRTIIKRTSINRLMEI